MKDLILTNLTNTRMNFIHKLQKNRVRFLLKRSYNYAITYCSKNIFPKIFTLNAKALVLINKINFSTLWGTLILFAIFLAVVLSIRGNFASDGKIMHQELSVSNENRPGSPYEVSISSGRYVLTRALATRGSTLLDDLEAQFASPDVARGQKGYASVFMPGVSFMALPLYLIGNYYKLPQLGSFLTGSLFFLLNVFLIFQIAKKVGMSQSARILACAIFALGLNTLAYSSLFTQHIYTITCLLLLILTLYSEVSLVKKNILIAGIYMFSFYFDFPNLIFLSPFVIYVFIQNFKNSYPTIIRNFIIFTSVSLFVLSALLVYNQVTFGKWYTLGQIVGNTSDFVTPSNSPYKNLPDDYFTQKRQKSQRLQILSLPFNTRNQIESTYTLLLSSERAWWYYSPVLVFGIIGIFLSWKNSKQQNLLAVLVSVGIFNLTLYSTFGDAWGGWAFGARYLLPSASILAIFAPLVLEQKFSLFKEFLYKAIFFVLFMISFAFNFLGALTTTAIPPKEEAVNLINETGWNMDLPFSWLGTNRTSSLVINYLQQNTSLKFTDIYTLAIRVMAVLILVLLFGPLLKKFVTQNFRKLFKFL